MRIDHRAHRGFFEASFDALVIVDADGRVRETNPALDQLLGYAPGELVGSPIEQLIPARFGDHAARRRGYLEAPRPRSMGSLVNLAARHRDGTEIPVDVALTPLVVEGALLVQASLRDLRHRAALGETLRVHATALRSAANGVVITDRRGVITWVNPAFTRMTGYAEAELCGQHTRVLKSGEHDEAFYRQLWTTILAGETWAGTIVNRRKDGTPYTEEQTIAPVLDDDGQVTHFIAIKQDVSERLRAEQALARANAELAERMQQIETLAAALREQAIRDPLTGLYNRRYFAEAIARDLADGRRTGRRLCVVVIDLDHFKRVNDSHGHDAGDRALVALAELLRADVRGGDLACRFGGEEFVLALPGIDLAIARARVEGWRRAFAALPLTGRDRDTFHASFSAGVAQQRDADETIEALLARADAALYQAKRDGRDRVRIAG